MLKFEPGSEGHEIVRDRILEALGRSMGRTLFGARTAAVLGQNVGREKSWTEIGEEFEANLRRQSDARDAIRYAQYVGWVQRPTMICCDDITTREDQKLRVFDERAINNLTVQRVGRIEDGPAPRLVHPTNTSEEKPVRLPRLVAYPFAFWRDNRLDAVSRNRPGSWRSFAYPCADCKTNRTHAYPAARWPTNRCKVIHDGLWKELMSRHPKRTFTFRELFSCDWVFEEQSWNPTRDKASSPVSRKGEPG